MFIGHIHDFSKIKEKIVKKLDYCKFSIYNGNQEKQLISVKNERSKNHGKQYHQSV